MTLTRKQVELVLANSPLKLEGSAGNYQLVNRYANQPVFAAKTLSVIRSRITTLLGV